MLHFSNSRLHAGILYIRTYIKIMDCSRGTVNDFIFQAAVYRKGAVMDDAKLTVAENLKNIRIGKGWSQSFVADQLGIAQRTISRAECGCGVSKRTIKMLCSMYQVSVASLYNDCVQEHPKEIQVVPDDVAIGLLIKNSFIQDLEREVILRYTDTIQKEALMMRADIEKIIPEALAPKHSYSMQDVITACMLTNQKTLSNIRQMAIA